MDESASTKAKVTILSDIVLKPFRSTPQNEILPSSIPPLAPLSNQNEIETGLINAQSVCNSINSSYQMTPSTSDTDITKIHITEESLKRKSDDIIIAYHETPKKLKLNALNIQSIKKEKVDSNGGETVFNYMTGAYEKVGPAVSPENNYDYKEEVTIQESFLTYEGMSSKFEAEDTKSGEAKLVTKLKQDKALILDNKKPPVTIDLTDDDDTERNTGVQNNIFIQNVLALQNAIALQNLVKHETDSKILFRNNSVLQNPSSPLKNLQSNVIIKNPSSILQNSNEIGSKGVTNIIESMSKVPLQNNLVIQNHNSPLKNLQVNAIVKSPNSILQNSISPNSILQSSVSPNSILQNSVKISSQDKTNILEAMSKVILQNNFVIQNHSSPLKNLQANATVKSSNSILQNTVKIGSQDVSNVVTTGAASQPLVLMVQNNSNFLVSPNVTSSNSLTHNLQGKFVLLPNNLNIQNNLVLTGKQSPNVSRVTNLVFQTNQSSPVKNVENSPQPGASQKKPVIILPENFVLKNTSPNLDAKANTNRGILPKTDKIAINSQTSGRLQTKNKLLSQMLSPNKSITGNCANKSPQNLNIGTSQNTVDSSQNFRNPNISSQNLTNGLQNLIACETCAHKARSRRDLILHIYNAHLKNDYELNFKCKICDFDTDVQSVMEKHDLAHGCDSTNQKLDNVCLSSNVELRIRPAKRKHDSVVGQKEYRSPDTDAPVEVIDLADSEGEDVSKKDPKGIRIFRCFDCNYLSSERQSLQNHVVRHFQSKFQCPKHTSRREYCSECEYKSCLLDLEKTVLVREKSAYRTFRKPCFEAPVKNQSEREGGNGNDALFSSNSDSNQGISETFKCFHCFYVASSLGLLKKHAVKHFGGSFMCDIHERRKSMTCGKCVYEMILEDLKYVVNACTCGFKTLEKSTYLEHTSRKRNCEAFIKAMENSAKGVLLEEIERKFEKSDGGNVNRKAGTGKSFKASEIGKNSGKFKCFHCTYITTSRDLLKFHAIKHCEQAFRCNLHLTSAEKACKKCLYRALLEELNKEVLFCQDCGFRTLRPSTFDRHKSKRDSCEKYRKRLVEELENQSESDSESRKRSSNTKKQKRAAWCPEVLLCAKCNYRATDEEMFKLHEKSHDIDKDGNKSGDDRSASRTLLNCFDCNEFCTEDREKLKNHAIAHYKKNFACDTHSPTENVADCGKCIYLSIKKEVENQTLICKKCSFKTLRLDIFQQHKSSKYPCRDYDKEIGDTDDDDYIPENDVGSGSDSAEDGLVPGIGMYHLRKEVENLSASTDAVAETDKDTSASKTSFYNFKCFDCDLQYVSQSALEMHVVAHPSSTFRCDDHAAFDELCKKCVYQYILEKASGKKMLSCKCCGYKSNDLEAMRNHIKSNINCENFGKKLDKANKCYDCDMQFDSRINLWKHAVRHKSDFQCAEHPGGTRNDCGKCLYAFIQKNVRPCHFQCFDCLDRSYLSELDLKGHIEVNHGSSKFRCDVHKATPADSCEKCRYAYMVVMTPQKIKYSCVDCEDRKLFSSWRSLKTHVWYVHDKSDTKCLAHTDKKPYLECHSCMFEKTLAHIRSQGLPNGYKCFECPLKMPMREKLEVHIRIMHEKSTFQCTTHSLGDIDDKCGMCVYESIVVLMNS